MSTYYKSISQQIKEIEYWLRLTTFLHGPLKQNLLCVLHNKKNLAYQGLPDDPSELYGVLSTDHKDTINKLQKKKVLKDDQLEILLPTNGDNKTYSDAFDVTLLVVLIINCTTLPPPKNGWYKPPLDSDTSVAANVIRARDWRNFLNHTDANAINKAAFNLKWAQGIAIIQGLGESINEMVSLRTISLDPKHELVTKSLIDFNQRKLADLQSRVVKLEGTIKQIDENSKAIEDNHTDVSKHLVEQNELMIADNDVIHNKIEEAIANHDQMLNQLQFISKEVEQLKTLKKENFVPANCTNNSETCGKDVLFYVAGELNKDWYIFLEILTNKSRSIKAMKTNGKIGKENIVDFFESIAFQLKWDDLKRTLLAMEKVSVVDHIEKNFLYTQALKLASNKLKQRYIEELIEWIIDLPLNPNEAGINCMSREQGYIDLAVLSGEQADAEWKNSDREAIMELRYLQLKSISIDDVWKPTDRLVIVRGVAGIGKSTMVQRYVLKWAKDEILTSTTTNDGKIDFLFFFECRELNTLPNMSSLEELLKEKYPHILQYIDLSDLRNIADRVMIILDGLDELQGIYDEDNSKETFPMADLVKRMIDTTSTILKGHKTIACGRPKACEFIKSKMHTQKIKTIEICGFNEKKTIEYIERFFYSNLERAEKVKEIIKRPNIRVMSSVPVFLWIICVLYSEDFEGEINSATELYTYGLFTFLKKHLRGGNHFETRSLSDLVSTQEFGDMVYSLSKLSVKTFMNHQVVFTDDDIKSIQCPVHLEQTGFIVKHAVGKFGQEVYQFKHLVFQEYLCALYLCLAKGVSKYNTNRELSSCTPTILGIHRFIKGTNNQLFVAFYQNLKMIHKISRTLKESVKAPYRHLAYNAFIDQHLNISKMIERHIDKRYERDVFNCNTHNFTFVELIRNFRENGWLFDEKQLAKLRGCDINVSTDQHRSLEVLEFLKSLKITLINDIFLAVLNEEGLFGKTDFDLIDMIPKHLVSTLAIHFSDSIIFSYYTRPYELDSILDIPCNIKYTIPNEIKEPADTYIVSGMTAFEGEAFDSVFHVVADLIGHVLENYKKKKLVLKKSLKFTIYNRLKRKVQSEFAQQEHFDKISFENE